MAKRGKELAKEVKNLCIDRGKTLATAESCTGGLIGSAITDIPGSSAFYLGGLITYSNYAKNQILGVPKTVLKRHGAVSKETAEAMSRGVLKLFKGDYGLSVTGIAGPGSVDTKKPVGLVFISLSYKLGRAVKTVSRKYLLKGSRIQIKRETREEALRLIIKTIKKR